MFCVSDMWGRSVSERVFLKATEVQPNELLIFSLPLLHSCLLTAHSNFCFGSDLVKIYRILPFPRIIRYHHL
jgi:hypothetical protein